MANTGAGARILYAYPLDSGSSSYGSSRAHFFDGNHYAQWKHKMKMHLKSINPSIWNIWIHRGGSGKTNTSR